MSPLAYKIIVKPQHHGVNANTNLWLPSRSSQTECCSMTSVPSIPWASAAHESLPAWKTLNSSACTRAKSKMGEQVHRYMYSSGCWQIYRLTSTFIDECSICTSLHEHLCVTPGGYVKRPHWQFYLIWLIMCYYKWKQIRFLHDLFLLQQGFSFQDALFHSQTPFFTSSPVRDCAWRRPSECHRSLFCFDVPFKSVEGHCIEQVTAFTAKAWTRHFYTVEGQKV